MSDLFAQHRKKPLGILSETAHVQAPPGYEAFGAKDKVERLRVRRAAGPTHAPAYSYLLDITYDGEYGTNFALVYMFLVVIVHGRNLQSVIAALEMNTADFIQEYDPSRWPKPTDPKAPFIESIEIETKESQQHEAPGNGRGGSSLH